MARAAPVLGGRVLCRLDLAGARPGRGAPAEAADLVSSVRASAEALGARPLLDAADGVAPPRRGPDGAARFGSR
jgi:hypothetical protein